LSATLSSDLIILIMAAILFIVGLITFLAGVFILLFRANSGEVKNLAVQTTVLANKGLSDGVSGLVGHATDLLDALDQLTRTTRGTGMFLSLAGLAMMVFACWMAITIYR
jgi:hypothetical protein